MWSQVDRRRDDRDTRRLLKALINGSGLRQPTVVQGRREAARCRRDRRPSASQPRYAHPERYRHGKKVLKRLNALAQDRFLARQGASSQRRTRWKCKPCRISRLRSHPRRPPARSMRTPPTTQALEQSDRPLWGTSTSSARRCRRCTTTALGLSRTCHLTRGPRASTAGGWSRSWSATFTTSSRCPSPTATTSPQRSTTPRSRPRCRRASRRS